MLSIMATMAMAAAKTTRTATIGTMEKMKTKIMIFFVEAVLCETKVVPNKNLSAV